MERTEINVAKVFSAYPFGRYPEHGHWNGERFRCEFVEPALAHGGAVVINFEGCRGLSPSFLEEAFGGLFRGGEGRNEDPKDLIGRIEFVIPHDPFLAKEIYAYMNEAVDRVAR
jgi:hypothetical protein